MERKGTLSRTFKELKSPFHSSVYSINVNWTATICWQSAHLTLCPAYPHPHLLTHTHTHSHSYSEFYAFLSVNPSACNSLSLCLHPFLSPILAALVQGSLFQERICPSLPLPSLIEVPLLSASSVLYAYSLFNLMTNTFLVPCLSSPLAYGLVEGNE